MLLLRVEACVSVMHRRSVNTTIKSSEQSETFSYTKRTSSFYCDLRCFYCMFDWCSGDLCWFLLLISDRRSFPLILGYPYKSTEGIKLYQPPCLHCHWNSIWLGGWSVHAHTRLPRSEAWPLPANNASLLPVWEHICVCKPVLGVGMYVVWAHRWVIFVCVCACMCLCVCLHLRQYVHRWAPPRAARGQLFKVW